MAWLLEMYALGLLESYCYLYSECPVPFAVSGCSRINLAMASQAAACPTSDLNALLTPSHLVHHTSPTLVPILAPPLHLLHRTCRTAAVDLTAALSWCCIFI